MELRGIVATCLKQCIAYADDIILTTRTKQSLFFDVLLTVHLSIFISVFKQLDEKNLFHNKFYFMPLHVSSTCARNM